MANFLKFGLIAGLLYSVYMIGLQLSGSDLRFNTTLGFSLMLIVPIIFMVMAVRSERSMQEGLISFGEALKTSFLTYLIFIVITVIVLQLVTKMYTPDDWNRMLEIQRDMAASMSEAVGMDQIQIDEAREAITIQSIKDQTTGISGIFLMVLSNSFFGLIFSLIISAIMKKNPTA